MAAGDRAELEVAARASEVNWPTSPPVSGELMLLSPVAVASSPRHSRISAKARTAATTPIAITSKKLRRRKRRTTKRGSRDALIAAGM